MNEPDLKAVRLSWLERLFLPKEVLKAGDRAAARAKRALESRDSIDDRIDEQTEALKQMNDELTKVRRSTPPSTNRLVRPSIVEDEEDGEDIK